MNFPKETKFSLRIFFCEHYLAPKIRQLDFGDEYRVPILRIFGSTPGGQKCCLHVHNVFPYFYVVSSTTNINANFLEQICINLNQAINLSLTNIKNAQKNFDDKKRRYVYKIEPVYAVPFYGFNENKELFLKISFYNPLFLKRAAELLENGSIMNFSFQPHEIHIPYILRFFIDYNLYGMDFVHLRDFKIRRPFESIDQKPNPLKFSSDQRSKSATPLSQKIFSLNDFSEDYFLPESIKRQSTCELEFDCLASDILNAQPNAQADSNDIQIQNPGLKFIWEDEKYRRRLRGMTSQLDPPASPDRSTLTTTDSESFHCKILDDFLKTKPLSTEEPEHRSVIQDSQGVAELSHSFSDFNSQDWSFVKILNDLQEDDSSKKEEELSVETHFVDMTLSESDDEPEHKLEKLELENRETFEMTQQLDSDWSDEDEFIAQLDGPPTVRKKQRITTDPEVIILDSDSDSSLDSKIVDTFMDFDDSQEITSPKETKQNDAQVWLTVGSAAAWKNQVADEEPTRHLRDLQASSDSDSRDTFQSTVDDELRADAVEEFTQIRPHSSRSEPVNLSEGFDSFYFVPETPPSPKLNETFFPFRIDISDFGAKVPLVNEKSALRRNSKEYSLKFRMDSELEGPSFRNTFGFNATEMNLADAQVTDDDIHLCVMTMELHATTRSDLNPDPEFDAIHMLFYTVLADAKSITVIGIIFSTDGLSDSQVAQVRSYSMMNKVDIQEVGCETDLFDSIVRLIRKHDPDILVGYDIQQLSWGYLIERATHLKIDLCAQLSRIPESAKESRYSSTDDWWSLADLHIAGRNCFNLWRLMRHELNLNIYTFENVAYHLLRLSIPKFAYSTLSKWYQNPYTIRLVLDHYSFRVVGESQFLFRTDLINRTCELARVFGVQFFDVLSRGSQFRVESMMLRLTKSRNFICVSPSVRQRRKMAAPECIPLTMEPESKFYTDPIVVVDFQSLYPSMCIAYNYCYSTCLGKISNYNESDQIEFGCCNLHVPRQSIERLRSDVHVSPAGVAFVKNEIRRGVIPVMLEEILNTRLMIKQSMKDYANDKNLMKILDARQLGLKLIANVTYGYTSANFSGRMPCVEVADSIVHKGRETLERAIAMVNQHPDWKARVVYGDTDSMFILLAGRSKQESFEIGKKIADAVTKMNPKPVKLKFEKVYYPCVLQTKKRYVGYAYETADQQEPKFDAKGIETVRRDSCAAVSKMLEKCLHVLFRTKSVDLVKKYTVTQFQKFLRGRVSSKDFVFAKEYRGREHYSKDAIVPALVLAKKRMQKDRRSEPRIKERVPYVIVTGQPRCTLISCVRDPTEATISGLRLNYDYYIQKQIGPALNRVFSLLDLNVLEWSNRRTLSQYFRLAECLCCRTMSNQDGLCRACESQPQLTFVELESRCRIAERKFDSVQKLCKFCINDTSSYSLASKCVSLDCSIFYKRLNLSHDFDRLSQIRNVLRDHF